MPEAPQNPSPKDAKPDRALLAKAALALAILSIAYPAFLLLIVHGDSEKHWMGAILLLLASVLFWQGPLALSAIACLAALAIRVHKARRGEPRPRGGGMLAAAAVVVLVQGAFIGYGISRATMAKAHREDIQKRLRAARIRGDEREARDLQIEFELPIIERELKSLGGALRRYQRKEGRYPPALIPYLVPPEVGDGRGLDLPHDWFGPPISQNYEYHADLGGWIRYFPGKTFLSSDRFARLDGTPIDHFQIKGSRINRFEASDREFYRYLSNGEHYVVFGVGPDGDDDSTTGTREQYLQSGNRAGLKAFEYDPTNGAQSSGDIFLTDVD